MRQTGTATHFGPEKPRGAGVAPTSGAKDDDGAGRLARLARTIEGEIVPRMIVAQRHKLNPDWQKPSRHAEPDELDVKELVRLLLAHGPGVAAAYIGLIRQRGVSLESICLDLLAPAARELGLLWEEDECDFMQVTVGLCRLHQVLRELSPAFACDEYDQVGIRRILLVAFPGEQHTFGITLVAQFLRRAAWEVCQEYPATVAELTAMVRDTFYSAVGISLATETKLPGVAKAIAALRKASKNPSLGVMVGGALLVANPDLAFELGADATASDGRHAVVQAERLRIRVGQGDERGAVRGR
jgi:methanogenic corrinoid protein MtbC1